MSHSVLIADDDVPTLALLQALLTHYSIPTVAVSDGRTALAALAAQQFDAIVLDLLMPGVNGFEVLRWLNANEPSLLARVIIVTAATDASWRGCTEIPSVRCLIRKPLDIEALTTQVRGCIADHSQATRSGVAGSARYRTLRP